MFLDIKLGLAWAFLVALAFDHPLTAAWILWGVVFALLPDIDFWIELARRKTVGGKVLAEHRTLLHNPIPYIPVALFVGTFFGPAWMTLFSLGIVGHFLHDSMGMGWGIRWLWPFSERWFKLFSDREGAVHFDRSHLLVTWSDRELRELVAQQGNDGWLREDIDYAKTHWRLIALRLSLAIVAIAALVAVLPL
jgi:LexA-binding, inner membrane-associated putative hydrolase